MPAKKVLTSAQFIAIGRRHGSEDVQKEGSEVAARWERDLAALKLFGFGKAGLTGFNALRDDHSKLLSERSTAVAAKTNAVGGRNTATSAAWAWVDMASSMLGELATTDAALATEVNAADPDDDGDLPAAIPALATILTKRKADLPEDADVQARVDEAPALAAALHDAPGAVAAAKAEPVIDTAEIDLLDGRLYAAISSLNAAGRKAVRHGKLSVPASEYTAKHLNVRGPTKPKPA